MLLSGSLSQAFTKPRSDHRRHGILGGELTYAYSGSFQEAGCRGIESHEFNTLGNPRVRYMAEQSRVPELSLPTHNPSPGPQGRRF